jgi:hypothetical protein
MMRELRQRLASPLVLFVICVLFFWKLVLTNQYTWLETSDIARQVLPWFQFQVGEWQQGRFPLWDPFTWNGQPLLAQAQPGAAYPFNWILFWMPTRHGWMKQATLHWYFVLIHFGAMLAAYALGRSLGARKIAAIAGGVLFGLGGYMTALDWPQMLNGAMWAPLILMFTLRAIDGSRIWANAASAGACLGMSLLAGHHQAPTFLAVAIAGVWIYAIIASRASARRLLSAMVLLFAIAGLVSALQTLPSWEYSKLAVRWVGAPEPVGHDVKVPYSIHQHYSLPPFAVLGVVLPSMFWHVNPYIGFVAAALAVLGAGLGWSIRGVRVAVVLAVAGLFLALGADGFLHGVLYSFLPIFDKARSPSAGIIIFHVACAALVAMGLEEAFRRGPGAWTRSAIRYPLIFAAVVLTVVFTVYLARDGKLTVDLFAAVTGFIAILFAALFAGWRAGKVAAVPLTVALVALMLVELSHHSTALFPHKNEAERNYLLKILAQNDDLVKFIHATPGGPPRVELADSDNFPNVSDWFGFESNSSYLASVTANSFDMSPWKPAARRVLGIRYLIGQTPSGDWNQKVFETKGGAKVFENPGAFPRVWTVHETESGWDRTRWRNSLDNPPFDYRRRAPVNGPSPALESCAAEDFAALLRRESTRVLIWTEMQCRGLVVLSDTYYPGWTATVDGRPAKILEVYGGLRGVVADRGAHRIEILYTPVSVYAGASLSLLGLISTFVIRRRDRADNSTVPLTENP